MRRFLLVVLSVGAAAACARGPAASVVAPRAPAAPDPPPGVMPVASGTILLTGIDFPDAGVPFGGHYSGVAFDIRQFSYQLTEAVRQRWTNGARDRAERILRGAGFRVRGVGPSSNAQQLFGVQYGLSGRMTYFSVRSTGTFEPYRVEAQVEVAWELLDIGSGTAIFGRTLRQATRETGLVDTVVAHAIDGTLERLVADSAFRFALAETRADPDAGTAVRFRDVPPPGSFIELVPGDLNPSIEPTLLGRVAAGLVTLRSPDNVFGTGFLITRDGLALTSARAVRNLRRLRARLSNGVERSLRVLRTSRGLDVALIQIECSECETVDWEAPGGVDSYTPVVVVAAPRSDVVGIAYTFGRVGGRWGLANGVTLEMTDSIMTGGEPVARTSSGRVFALVSTRSGRKAAILLSEVLGALRVRGP